MTTKKILKKKRLKPVGKMIRVAAPKKRNIYVQALNMRGSAGAGPHRDKKYDAKNKRGKIPNDFEDNPNLRFIERIYRSNPATNVDIDLAVVSASADMWLSADRKKIDLALITEFSGAVAKNQIDEAKAMLKQSFIIGYIQGAAQPAKIDLGTVINDVAASQNRKPLYQALITEAYAKGFEFGGMSQEPEATGKVRLAGDLSGLLPDFKAVPKMIERENTSRTLYEEVVHVPESDTEDDFFPDEGSRPTEDETEDETEPEPEPEPEPKLGKAAQEAKDKYQKQQAAQGKVSGKGPKITKGPKVSTEDQATKDAERRTRDTHSTQRPSITAGTAPRYQKGILKTLMEKNAVLNRRFEERPSEEMLKQASNSILLYVLNNGYTQIWIKPRQQVVGNTVEWIGMVQTLRGTQGKASWTHARDYSRDWRGLREDNGQIDRKRVGEVKRQRYGMTTLIAMQSDPSILKVVDPARIDTENSADAGPPPDPQDILSSLDLKNNPRLLRSLRDAY